MDAEELVVFSFPATPSGFLVLVPAFSALSAPGDGVDFFALDDVVQVSTGVEVAVSPLVLAAVESRSGVVAAGAASAPT